MKEVTFNNTSPSAGTLTDLLHAGGEASERKLVELENALTAFAAMTTVPVAFHALNARQLWTCDAADLRPCLANRAFNEEGSACLQSLCSSMEKSESLGDVYIFRCLTGFICFSYALVLEDRLQGYLLAGPIIMEKNTEKFITAFLRRSTEEEIDYSVFFPITNRMRIFTPREVNHLATLFRNAIFSSLEITAASSAAYRASQEQILISNMLTKRKKENINIEYPYDLETRLTEAVRAGDYPDCRDTFTRYIDELMIYEEGSPTAARIRLIALSAQLLGENEQWQYSRENLGWIEEINRSRTLSEMARAFDGLLRSCTDSSSEAIYHGNSEIVKKAIAWINANYGSDINVKTVASAIHVNSSYLSTLFRKEMNQSAVDYIQSVRIARGKTLLENTRMSAAGISVECGFSSQSYFTRIFREKTGMTPNEYRRRQTPHTR